MISLLKNENELLLRYRPEFNDGEWILDNLRDNNKVSFQQIFHFSQDELIDEDDEFIFLLGYLENGYYKIDGQRLEIDINVFIQNDINIKKKMFVTTRNISVFKHINHVLNEDIFIGDGENDLPLETFEELLKDFPNSYELQKYADAKIGSIIADYFEDTNDVQGAYQRYLQRNKRNYIGENLTEVFAENEAIKYELILSKLRKMLNDENNYLEKQWQKEILEIITLIFPNYLFSFPEVPIKDIHQRNRYIDYILVDANGDIDAVEIKKPFENKVMTKTTYRDNHIPYGELTGSVMQLEKYIFNLNKSGQNIERNLTKKYKNELPEGFEIRITNPGGIVIMGRDNNLTEDQLRDFRIIKRQYKNIIDIFTYDDIIAMLENIIEKFRTT